jgi:hypothetical protein
VRLRLRPGGAMALARGIVVVSGLGLAACSGSGGSTGGGFTDRISSMVYSPPPKPGQGPTRDEDLECPPLDVRQGASTITVYGPGEQASTNVRYQATVAQLARECSVQGATMNIKVGLQGRIIMGPAGGPGRLDIPVRIALVHEGPAPKTIWTKLYKVAVDIPGGQPHVAFTHVEDNVTFPKPTAGDLEAYVIYTGFDQVGAKATESKPRGRRGTRAR